jgi:hypothetical protein
LHHFQQHLLATTAERKREEEGEKALGKILI